LYIGAKKKKRFKPFAIDLEKEIERRLAEDQDKAAPPKMTLKSATLAAQWLKDNPPKVLDEDLGYLQDKILSLRTKLEAARQAEPKAKWCGYLPYLRLYEAIFCNEETMSAFHHRHDAMTRLQLDARNSAQRDPTPYEVIAQKFNDTAFNPVSEICPWHYHFEAQHDLSWETVNVSPITSQQVRERLTDVCGKLTRMNKNFCQSGRGEFDRVETPADEGVEHQSSTEANFQGENPSHVLYFWFIAKKHNLLGSACGNLVSGTGASSQHVASVYHRPKSSRLSTGTDADTENWAQLATMVNQTNNLICINGLRHQIESAERSRDEKRKSVMEYRLMSIPPREKEALKDRDDIVQQLKSEITKIEAKLADLNEQLEDAVKEQKSLAGRKRTRPPEFVNLNVSDSTSDESM
jgi:hypothetical protein